MSGTDSQDTTPHTPTDTADSSPAPETTTVSPSSGSDSQAAAPSPAEPQSDREGLLAAVKAVIAPKPATEDDQASPAAAAETDQQGTTEADASASQPSDATKPEADWTERDIARLKPETQRRFRRLMQQRDEASQALQAVQPDLAQHRQLQGYLQQHQLAPDDVNLLLGVGAALRRGDYQAFLNGVGPYVQAAQEAIGARIAPDLQRQVDDGLVSEAAARELTRTRHRALQAEQRVKEESGQRAQDQTNRRVAEVRSAIETWEAGIRSRDPDYQRKADVIRRFSQAYMQEQGIPQTPDAAVKLVQAAYDDATRQFAAARPAPRPTRPSPSGINGASIGALAEPRSMKEAAVMALRNMRRAS